MIGLVKEMSFDKNVYLYKRFASKEPRSLGQCSSVDKQLAKSSDCWTTVGVMSLENLEERASVQCN